MEKFIRFDLDSHEPDIGLITCGEKNFNFSQVSKGFNTYCRISIYQFLYACEKYFKKYLDSVECDNMIIINNSLIDKVYAYHIKSNRATDCTKPRYEFLNHSFYIDTNLVLSKREVKGLLSFVKSDPLFSALYDHAKYSECEDILNKPKYLLHFFKDVFKIDNQTNWSLWVKICLREFKKRYESTRFDVYDNVMVELQKFYGEKFIKSYVIL